MTPRHATHTSRPAWHRHTAARSPVAARTGLPSTRTGLRSPRADPALTCPALHRDAWIPLAPAGVGHPDLGFHLQPVLVAHHDDLPAPRLRHVLCAAGATVSADERRRIGGGQKLGERLVM